MVNNRHAGDTAVGNMLDEFVKRNSCNLIWMEPEEAESSYPSFSRSNNHIK